MQKPPFIVTAGLPSDIFAWADRLRRLHFPPERNHLHAHVTLFHSFTPSLFDELKTVLPRFSAEFAPVSAKINGLMDLGKGTALSIESAGMLHIRQMIADHFHGSHVAGIIAAIVANDAGVHGAAPGVQIIPIRVLDGGDAGNTADVAEAII